ncbi:hypothetical protein N9L68_06575 [bacterium]|nr:hypothetical protein [bacterium]
MTFVNGESSVTIAGQGAMALEKYASLRQVGSQIQHIEEVLAHDGIGFKKRFNMRWPFSTSSRVFLMRMMAWGCKMVNGDCDTFYREHNSKIREPNPRTHEQCELGGELSWTAKDAPSCNGQLNELYNR